MINSFRGKYYFLSNFYPSEILIGGKKYTTVEHTYQAMKAVNGEDLAWIACAATPSEAKKRGNEIICREDWENVKLPTMKAIIYLKFRTHLDLLKQLIATGNEELVEGNWWNDTFWGICNGVGENHLGKILMEVRDSLK